jgi:hypothetical protein
MKPAILLVTALFYLTSCGTAERKKSQELSAVKVEFEKEAGLLTDTSVAPGIITDQKQKDAPVIKSDWDKKIVKTANLNIEVKEYKSYYTRLRESIRSAGGYIAQENQSQSDYKLENVIVIKVPVDQFETALASLTDKVEKVNEKKISSQDVTAEFVDTRSRLEAKKQVRLKYLDLLKQARNMEEILNVQSEINDIQEQIEAATGRIDYLSHAAAFSTIELTYYQVLNSAARNSGKPRFGTEVREAFTTGWGWIKDLFVGIVSIWPLVLLVIAGIIYIKRSRLLKPKQVAS